MNDLIKYAALAVFVGGGMGVAKADVSETKGGIVIKTEDGRFEAKVGGRIHFDGNFFIDDDEAVVAGTPPDYVDDQFTTDLFFRRARLSLEGKAYGWSYKFENDFAGQSGTSGSGFREMWIGTSLYGHNVRIGQAKPYRSMEELTSSNEISFMERPFSSATALFGSRQFQLGAFVDRSFTNFGYGVSVHNLRSADGTRTDGVGAGGRVYFAPIMTETQVFHVGATAGVDNPTNNSNNSATGTKLTVSTASVRFAGRQGPQQSLGVSTSEEQTTYGLELATKLKTLYGQAEYMKAEFGQDAADDLEIDTYYIQGSWMITGESKPYDIKKGVFKSPKPAAPIGAWEAKFRYDVIESKEVAIERDITQYILGLNWYVNPNVRMMFEYISGEQEPETGLETSADVFATRLQFAF